MPETTKSLNAPAIVLTLSVLALLLGIGLCGNVHGAGEDYIGQVIYGAGLIVLGLLAGGFSTIWLLYRRDARDGK